MLESLTAIIGFGELVALDHDAPVHGPAARNTETINAAGATVARTISVPENVSLQGREDAWHSLVERMMADLNAKLEEGIDGNLTAVTLR